MTLEISLRRPFSIPRVFQARKDKPHQDFHWIGQKPAAKHGADVSKGGNQNPQDEKSKQKYRPLSDITLGEVDDVYQRFEHQLLLAQENWIGITKVEAIKATVSAAVKLRDLCFLHENTPTNNDTER